LFSILVDRLIDIGFVVLSGYVGLLVLRSTIGLSGKVLLGISAGGILIVAVLWLLVKNKWQRVFESGMDGIKGWFNEAFSAVWNNYSMLRQKHEMSLGRVASKIILITVVSYLFYFATVYLIILALGLKVSFVFVVVSYSVVTLVAVLPISISGVGTRDVSLIFFFSLIGISAEKAVGVSLIDLVVMNYGVILLLLGIVNVMSLIKKRYYLSRGAG